MKGLSLHLSGIIADRKIPYFFTMISVTAKETLVKKYLVSPGRFVV
jgi:hypothetical protein